VLTEGYVTEKFAEGIDCSMLVLADVAEKIGITTEEAYRTASLFGAGMSLGSVCGAVTGAFIALGIRYGNHKLNDTEQKDIVFGKRDEFVKRFKDVHGSVNCPVLLGTDISDPEKRIKARNEGLFADICPKFCVTASRILEDMIGE
jgi:C_GCAxxG_C_C family probable redox protein